jgi:hypothetical protein
MPDHVVTWALSSRVRKHSAWQNYGNGNAKSKADIWLELAEAAKGDDLINGDPWVQGLEQPALATKFNLKWDGARKAFKDYKTKCNKSGEGNVHMPKLLQLNPTFVVWCNTQPDLTLAGLSVSTCAPINLLCDACVTCRCVV